MTLSFHRLSSFGLNGNVLTWIKSYLTSRSFKVCLNGSQSSVYQLLYGVPQGSVLGPLLFILYTTPLSSIISQTPVNHHLYADDTQLYISFFTFNFPADLSHLQDTISKISTWMSSNLLALNQSKTEFLLMGLPKQLSKITHPILQMSADISVSSVSSARNLGIIFDSTLSMSDHISYISKSCFSLVRDLRRIRCTLDLNTAKLIATSLVHSRLDYCNSLFLNLPSSELNRLQLILNTAARAITKTPKIHHITPILKSLHWLKINERIHYKILSIRPKEKYVGFPVTRPSLVKFVLKRSFTSILDLLYVITLSIVVCKKTKHIKTFFKKKTFAYLPTLVFLTYVIGNPTYFSFGLTYKTLQSQQPSYLHSR